MILVRKADGNFRSDDFRWLFLRYELGWNVRDRKSGKFFNTSNIQEAQREVEDIEHSEGVEIVELGLVG